MVTFATLAALLSNVGYALLLLTSASAALAARRSRDLNHLNILAVVGALFLWRNLPNPPGTPAYSVKLMLVLAQPFFLLRLVHLFRDVSRLLRAASVIVPVIGAIVFFAWPLPRPAIFDTVIWSYVASLMAYITWQFGSEARRTRGVTATRLVSAALGTLAFVALFLLTAASGSWSKEWGREIGLMNQALPGVVFICYFMAFSPPRRLVSAVQRTEQARYLSLTAERDAEDRGAHATDDLRQAAASSVGNAAILVAVRATTDTASLVVRSASHESLRDLTFVPSDGLLGRAFRTGPLSGTPFECEADLASRLVRFGARVLVAPLTTSTHTWGLVIVVQRRGSLFPEDDLQLLAQLGKYAATALDHAALVTDARERDRRAADRRLREAESVMTLMLDSIKDYAMFVVDDHGHVVTWQIGAEHVFGYTSAEMVDQPAGPLYGMDDEAFVAMLEEARVAGRAEREGECRKHDGAKFLGLTSIRPLESLENLGGFVAVTRDVSERRDLENRLRQSLKMEAIGRLAGGIAHDFNNILTAILGYADWLAKDFKHDAPHLQQVSEIQRAAERAAGLTRQLLAFSRQQMLKPAPVSVARLVSELTPMLRRLIGAEVEIVTNLTRQSSVVLGDRHQVEQIIVNLAVNARDAMPAGGKLTMRVSPQWLDEDVTSGDAAPGPFVQLAVTDTGVGMDALTQSRMFEPFFTTKEVGKGTGLGLATVYGIVKQMGGLIRVNSAIGHGTTFLLDFPASTSRELTAAEPVETATTQGTETLLLVEDEESVRTFLTRLLEEHGYRVLVAEDPKTALAHADSHPGPIHLILSDVVLPGGNGPDLVRAIVQMRPRTPALFMSGYADAVLAQRGTHVTPGDLIQKPFSATDLLARIRHALQS